MACLGEGNFLYIESTVPPESHDDEALPMLGHEMLGIDHASGDAVPKFVPQRIPDHAVRIATIVGPEVLDIFQQESAWFPRFYDPRDIKEQCPLCRAFKSMRT